MARVLVVRFERRFDSNKLDRKQYLLFRLLYNKKGWRPKERAYAVNYVV